jgi:hypothetical protein
MRGRNAAVLLAQTSAAHTVSGNSGDLICDQYQELAVDVNVTAVTGTNPSMTLSIQRKGADGVYYPIWTSSAITAPGVTSVSIGPGLAQAASIGDIVLLVWTITGTTPSFTFSASIIAK